jgi:Heterokaryon incompatibility protein (HET)
MRLINTETLQLKVFHGKPFPEYAILSHTWENDEITFEDTKGSGLGNAELEQRKAYAKIVGMCNKAREYEFEWVWIDSCCIDKSSSAELQEAINSMWNWYENSTTCFVYLSDVLVRAEMERSRWFTRGWTLQELVAPDDVEFFNKDWLTLGTKFDLIEQLHFITKIDIKMLRKLEQKQLSQRQRE